eukprot:gene8277-14233_t
MSTLWLAVYSLAVLSTVWCDVEQTSDNSDKKLPSENRDIKTTFAKGYVLENYTKDEEENDSKLDLVLGRLVKLQSQLNSLRTNVETMCAPENLRFKKPTILRVIEKSQCQTRPSEIGIRYQIENCGEGTSKLGNFFIANGSSHAYNRDDLFCTVFVPFTIPEKQYVAKAKIYNVISFFGTYYGFPGIAFNIENGKNFDFVIIRLHSRLGCFQTGYMQNGAVQYVRSKSGSCYKHPEGRTWFNVEVQVMTGEATLFIDGFQTVKFSPHFSPIGRAGVLVKHGDGNIIRFKDLTVAPFYKRQLNVFECSKYHRINANYYRLDSKEGNWPDSGFCKSIGNFKINSTEYSISVFLFNQRGPDGGHQSGRLGIMFNAHDENNFDFVYFRPEDQRACYFTGFVRNSRITWSNAKIGACPGGPFKGGAWNNVTIYVRNSNVVVYLEGRHILSTETHFKSRPVGGVIVSNDNAINVISFKDFKINAISPADVTFYDCHTNTHISNSYYLLDANHGVWPNDTFCRAFGNEVLHGDNYKISAEMFITESKVDKKINQLYGLAYNIRNTLNYDFIVLRPNKDSCYSIGHVFNGVVNFDESLNGKCPNGPPKKGSWFEMSVTVWQSMAVIYLEEKHILTIKPKFQNSPRGGVIVSNGNRNILTFRKFKQYLIPPLEFELTRCGPKTDVINGTFLLHAAQPYWPSNLFCSAFYKKPFETKTEQYTLEAMLQNVNSHSGVYLGHPGLMFNALDQSTFDYVYLR